MRTVLRAAVHALERGSPVELVTVLSASGSTPPGARRGYRGADRRPGRGGRPLGCKARVKSPPLP